MYYYRYIANFFSRRLSFGLGAKLKMVKIVKATTIKIHTILNKEGEFQENVTDRSILNMCKEDYSKMTQFLQVLGPFLQQQVMTATKKVRSARTDDIVPRRKCLLTNNPALFGVLVDWFKVSSLCTACPALDNFLMYLNVVADVAGQFSRYIELAKVSGVGKE